MSMSPDGGTVVSIGADEQIKFWDFFGLSSRKSFPSKDFSLVLPSLGMQSIR
jgi:WD40 repeat protein